MYSYEYDNETGGIILNSTPLAFSKEPRPVYYKELDILGFDKHWNYDKDDSYPYMWAEANCYYYYGNLVAKTKGGSLYNAPELIMLEAPEPKNKKLRHINIEKMVKKNLEMIEVIEQSTIKKIFDVYKRYKYKIDVFHVAFSGGKDSIVLLDLVKKALPKDDFLVVFGDTGMEFPDTYDVIKKTKLQCEQEGIGFYIAKSHLDAKESWKIFGPPAHVLRWCCSVHKSAPQVLALRKILKKANYKGLAFVGVRSSESLARSQYEFFNYGEKTKGQSSFNPILAWNSAELYLYIYKHNLNFNPAYKKGNNRVGCLFCPASSGKSDFIQYKNYYNEIDEYIKIILECNGRDDGNKEAIASNSYINNCGWNARKNGRDIKNNPSRYKETKNSSDTTIEITPTTNWKIWIKTLGTFYDDGNKGIINWKNLTFTFSYKEERGKCFIVINSDILKSQPLFGKLFRRVFRKAAYCAACKTCEANCPNGCLSFQNNQVEISDTCSHCCECHDITNGCLRYNSLTLPGEGMGMKSKSVNCYSNHAPKMEWIEAFLKLQNDFWDNNSLGTQQQPFFKRFLRDSELINNDNITKTASKLIDLGISSLSFWGIILVNLTYNSPQIAWYVQNLENNTYYTRDRVVELLITQNENMKRDVASSIINAYGRIVALPFGSLLNFGSIEKKGSNIISILRGTWNNPDPKVVLYSLYKFAEACGGYYQFTLSRLLNFDIDSDGISPAQIFGLDRDKLEPLLMGLNSKFPDFISATFTHDLDKISLQNNKTSADVLELF